MMNNFYQSFIGCSINHFIVIYQDFPVLLKVNGKIQLVRIELVKARRQHLLRLVKATRRVSKDSKGRNLSLH